MRWDLLKAMMKEEMMHGELTFTPPKRSHFPVEFLPIDFALFHTGKKTRFKPCRKRIADHLVSRHE